MLITPTFSHQLDDLLQRVCSGLQVSATQYQSAVRSYNAVAEWLSGDEQLKDIDIEIYPQGSLRIGTTVKPLFQQEFDLDFVCEFKVNWTKIKEPLSLLDVVERRLRAHGTYASMVERKKRCVRLKYANDFHMDILPACPVDESDDHSVKVPDRELQDWTDSNPKGYAQWFDAKADDYEPLFKDMVFLEKADIERIPDPEPVDVKAPLKRAVQLIKRYRDIQFKENSDDAPISIVLTTLAGEGYRREGSVNDTILGILGQIQSAVRNGKIVVKNPKNPKEILSERWDHDPRLYTHFVLFIQDFYQKWSKLQELKTMNEIAPILKEMFGENTINEGLRKQTEYMESLRKKGKLGVTPSGGLTALSSLPIVKIQRNTFYGSKS